MQFMEGAKSISEPHINYVEEKFEKGMSLKE